MLEDAEAKATWCFKCHRQKVKYQQRTHLLGKHQLENRTTVSFSLGVMFSIVAMFKAHKVVKVSKKPTSAGLG